MPHHSSAVQHFSLLRWFSLLSFVTIALGAAAAAALLSQYLTHTLLDREARVMTEFVNSILRVEEADRYLGQTGDSGLQGDVEEFFRHLGHLPGMLRANVYNRDRVVLWSSDPQLIGRRFPVNEDLDVAFTGQPGISMGVVGQREKQEHLFFQHLGQRFIESYLPVWQSGAAQVLAVVEVYRSPAPLFQAIEEGVALIWLAAVAAGLLLFFVLYGLVRRADGLMRRQRQRLVESEKLAVIGEMAATVAHSLRNPLASMRAAAEYALECDPNPEVRGQLQEIVSETDRLALWVRQYLSRSELQATSAHSRLDQTVTASLEHFGPELQRRRVQPVVEVAAGLPAAGISPLLLVQVLNGLVANALEAMPGGGNLWLQAGPGSRAGTLDLAVTDGGPGLNAEQMEAAFQPFTTGKSNGLGLGLPLARRILERHGGSPTLHRAAGGGVTARVTLPVAE